MSIKEIENYNQDFASVWASMDRRDQQMAESNARMEKQMAESNARMEKQNAESKARMDEELSATNRVITAMGERVDALVATVDKSYAEFLETRKEVGKMGNSYGMYAESYFYESLKKTKQFGGITYKQVVNGTKGTLTLPDDTMIVDEFDIVMHDGDSIAIIEVKTKVQKEDVLDLINRKIGNYKLMSPQYAHKKFYLGVAGFFIKKDAEEEALKRGVGILKLSGENLEIQDGHLTIF